MGDVVYLVAGHSQYESKKKVTVPRGVVYVPVASCSELVSEAQNSHLTQHLKTANGVVKYISSKTKYTGVEVPDVYIGTSDNNGFHGILSLPLNKNHNLTKRNTIRRHVSLPETGLYLRHVFNIMHKKHEETGHTYYVIGNYCAGLKTVKSLQTPNGHKVSVKGVHVVEGPLKNVVAMSRHKAENLKNKALDPNFDPRKPNANGVVNRRYAKLMNQVLKNLKVLQNKLNSPV